MRVECAPGGELGGAVVDADVLGAVALRGRGGECKAQLLEPISVERLLDEDEAGAVELSELVELRRSYGQMLFKISASALFTSSVLSAR